MFSLKSNKKSLALLEIGLPAESQPKAPSLLHFFPGSREFECVFSEVTCMGSPHVATGIFKDRKKFTWNPQCCAAVFCTALWRVSSSGKGDWKQLSLHFYMSFTLLVPQWAISAHIISPTPLQFLDLKFNTKTSSSIYFSPLLCTVLFHMKKKKELFSSRHFSLI